MCKIDKQCRDNLVKPIITKEMTIIAFLHLFKQYEHKNKKIVLTCHELTHCCNQISNDLWEKFNIYSK